MRAVLRVLPLLPLLAFLLSSSAVAQVKDEVSDVTGVHRIVSEELRDIAIDTYAGNDAALAAEYESDPDESESTTWVMAFYGFAESPTGMATASQVSLLVDGRPVQPLRVEGRVRRLDGSVVEIKKAYFTRPVYDRIGRASEVTATIGTATFEVSKSARQDMRIILDKVPSDAKRPTARNGNATNR